MQDPSAHYSLLTYVFAFANQLPRHLLFAVPWFLIFVPLVCVAGRNFEARGLVVLAASFVGAIGISPAFSPTLVEFPFILGWMTGKLDMVASFRPLLLIWTLLFFLLKMGWRSRSGGN